MSRPAGSRLANGLLWVGPVVFCIWLHWYGMKAWFWSDDFAWLGLHTGVFDRASFLSTMFSPLAQGTIRPWSERGFFLLFYQLFGLNAVPYHALVFATQAANLVLLIWIVRKVSGSLSAGAAAAVLWSASAGLVVPMSWVSDYNQILCAFFLLAAFALYLSGRYWAQFIVFVLGFGALEINIIYPAILLGWLLLNRKSIRPALPLIAVSVAYFVLHTSLAAPQPDGPYALHFNLTIFRTLGTYWKWICAPQAWLTLPHHRSWMAWIATALITTAILRSLVRSWIGGDRLPVFFLSWVFLPLIPILPLSDHVTEYYLAIPELGIACILALELRNVGWRAYRNWLVPVGAAVLYLFMQAPSTRQASRWYFERSAEVRTVVRGVIRARQLHPGQTILLQGLTPYLYATSLAHSPFHVVGIDQVYLSPDTRISTFENLVPPAEHVLAPDVTLRGLEAGTIQVYKVNGPVFKNVTSSYAVFAANNF